MFDQAQVVMRMRIRRAWIAILMEWEQVGIWMWMSFGARYLTRFWITSDQQGLQYIDLGGRVGENEDAPKSPFSLR